MAMYNVTVMSVGKTFRHGQILRLVSGERIANQDDLRRRLASQRLRVTQATLSRDLQELKLVKTPEGYKQATTISEEVPPLPPLARALREWLQLREDLEDGQVAAERIAEYNRTGRAATQDEIREQLSRRPPRRA